MEKIYIVEDDVNILEIESYALSGNGYTVEGFEKAGDFFERVREELPDLVMLDIMLPDMDGLTVLKKLRKDTRTSRLPVIMVTAKATEIDTVRGLDLGADDYLTKPFGVMELISRVRALLRRSGIDKREERYVLGSIVLSSDERSCTVSGDKIELTFKEFELLYILMKNAGIVLKREVLMDRVWGTDFEGESRTLDMHIKTLRQKLGDEGTHIQTVRNVGYVAR
jgi:two-component system alkaline phosphatase synthesis response regulator PhoP